MKAWKINLISHLEAHLKLQIDILTRTRITTQRKHTAQSLSCSLSHAATSSVTGLFSSLVFRVYSWSCVCARDPSRCSRSNVRLPFHLRVCMCVCVSQCVTHNLIQRDKAMFTPSALYHREPAPTKLSLLSFPFSHLGSAYHLESYSSSLPHKHTPPPHFSSFIS